MSQVTRSERYHLETGDEAEVALVGGEDGEAQGKGSGADHEIDGRNRPAQIGLLRANARSKCCDMLRIRDDRQGTEELCKEGFAEDSSCAIGFAVQTMKHFSEAYGGHGEGLFTTGCLNALHEFFGGHSCAVGCNDRR